MTDPASNKTEGYHLFFEPADEVRVLLSSTIQSLAQEYGAPVFEPHITLLAKIPEADEEKLMQKAQQLARLCAPFSLTLEGFGAENAYFRALYMTVRNTDEVARCHEQARAVFGRENEEVYMPHLSLLYGIYDESKKRETIESLADMSPLTFPVTSLSLWHTPGDTSTWKKVMELPFGSSIN